MGQELSQEFLACNNVRKSIRAKPIRRYKENKKAEQIETKPKRNKKQGEENELILLLTLFIFYFNILGF